MLVAGTRDGAVWVRREGFGFTIVLVLGGTSTEFGKGESESCVISITFLIPHDTVNDAWS